MTTAGTFSSQHFAKKRVMISAPLRKEVEEKRGGGKMAAPWGQAGGVIWHRCTHSILCPAKEVDVLRPVLQVKQAGLRGRCGT